MNEVRMEREKEMWKRLTKGMEALGMRVERGR